MDKPRMNTDPDDLRQRAEDRMPDEPMDNAQLDDAALAFAPGQAGTARLLHELQVHQIELEMQNESLLQAQVELEDLARNQADHLRELAGDLTRAEQRERDHLRDLLHDEVQPLLVAARLSLSGLNPGSSQENCLRVAAESCQHLSRVIQFAHTLSLSLSPPLIRERGLNAALASLCGWVKENHGLEVNFSSTVETEPDDVALRLLCFNAVRELLFNVAKHAGTKQVSLSLQCIDPDTLLIKVADQGDGFDAGTATGGSGLAGIGRRLGMLGGVLRIDSRRGHGTIATLLVPLHPTTNGGWLPGNRDRRLGAGAGAGHAQNTDRR